MENSTGASRANEALADNRELWTGDFVFIALINFFIFIGFNMINVGMPLYISSLGANPMLTGLATTLATLATLLVRPFSGLLLDQIGRKRPLLIGLAAMAIVTAAYAFFPIVLIVLAIRCLHGMAWGLTSTASSTIAADLIPRKRFAEGMGYFALSTAVAVAIAPALALGVMQGYGAILMFAIAATCTLISLSLAFFQKSAKTEKPVHLDKPGEIDLFENRAALPAIIMMFINCTFGAITTFIALHGKAQQVEDMWLYFTVYAVVTLVSRPLIGKIIDKKGFFGPGIFSMCGVIITLITIGLADNLMMFCLAGAFCGVGLGTGMATFQSMAVSTVPPARRGIATATFFFGFDAGIGIGAACAGFLSGIIGYSNMFFTMIVFPVLALIIIIKIGREKMLEYSAN